MRGKVEFDFGVGPPFPPPPLFLGEGGEEGGVVEHGLEVADVGGEGEAWGRIRYNLLQYNLIQYNLLVHSQYNFYKKGYKIIIIYMNGLKAHVLFEQKKFKGMVNTAKYLKKNYHFFIYGNLGDKEECV